MPANNLIAGMARSYEILPALSSFQFCNESTT